MGTILLVANVNSARMGNKAVFRYSEREIGIYLSDDKQKVNGERVIKEFL